MGNVDINQIIQLLLPSQQRLVWDIWLYAIMLFLLITLFMQPEGSVTVTLLLAGAVVSVFIDKVHGFPNHTCNFGTLLIRILMFVAPLLTAGISQNPKSRGPAIVAALLALGYTFLLWAIEMNNRNVCAPLPRDVRLWMDYFLVLPA